MNLMMVDITDIKNAKVGDEVVLIGKQGSQEITADEIAKTTGTMNYEIVSRINPHLPRIYV
jgi:alanine racemase